MASRVFTEPSEVKSALYSQNPIQSAAISSKKALYAAAFAAASAGAMVEVPFKPRLK